MLKRHLSTDHAVTPAEYTARWNLNSPAAFDLVQGLCQLAGSRRR
jgi:predicted transcriptional regulator